MFNVCLPKRPLFRGLLFWFFVCYLSPSTILGSNLVVKELRLDEKLKEELFNKGTDGKYTTLKVPFYSAYFGIVDVSEGEVPYWVAGDIRVAECLACLTTSNKLPDNFQWCALRWPKDDLGRVDQQGEKEVIGVEDQQKTFQVIDEEYVDSNCFESRRKIEACLELGELVIMRDPKTKEVAFYRLVEPATADKEATPPLTDTRQSKKPTSDTPDQSGKQGQQLLKLVKGGCLALGGGVVVYLGWHFYQRGAKAKLPRKKKCKRRR